MAFGEGFRDDRVHPNVGIRAYVDIAVCLRSTCEENVVSDSRRLPVVPAQSDAWMNLAPGADAAIRIDHDRSVVADAESRAEDICVD